jgi:hypothetical protein
MSDVVSQVLIFVFGVSAIFLVCAKTERVRRWGYIVGLAGQPFWFYQFYIHQQWIMFGIACAYTVSWIYGVWNHWIAGKE